jgi:type IV secretion system protein VirB6
MIGYRAELLAYLSPIGMLVNPQDPFSILKDMVDSSKYTMKFEDQHDGDWGVFADLSLGQTATIFPWKVVEHNDRICVETLSFIGWLRVGCKYIAEPFPKSAYGEFLTEKMQTQT